MMIKLFLTFFTTLILTVFSIGVVNADNVDDEKEPASSCDIKGNVASSGEKIYHVPGQRFDNVTKITRTKGERYFCTEREAREAGWRKSKV